jgi:hypothetical protein
MPQHGKIIYLATQNGKPCLWVELFPNLPKEKRTIEIFGTGHPLDEDIERIYLGSYQLHNGDLIFHVFEKP